VLALEQSEVYVDTGNVYKADSYHRIDAAIQYQNERYNAALTIKNLTNEDYYEYYKYLDGRLVKSAGPTAYLTFSIKY
jgi:iron complex outermembrane receptor protein